MRSEDQFCFQMSKVESPFIVSRTIGTKRLFSRGVFFTMIGEAQDGMVQNVSIGRYCSIAQHVNIGHGEHPLDWASAATCFYVPDFAGYGRYLGGCVATHKWNCFRNTEIGNDVWIGEHAIVKAGVRIGEGAVVAVCAFVDNDVPPYAIMSGAPVRLIRMWFDDDTVKRLQASGWWRCCPVQFSAVDDANSAAMLKAIESRVLSSVITYEPEQMTVATLRQYWHRTLFWLEVRRTRVRIKILGVWVVHFIAKRKGA